MNIMILCIFKFAAQDNKKCVFWFAVYQDVERAKSLALVNKNSLPMCLYTETFNFVDRRGGFEWSQINGRDNGNECLDSNLLTGPLIPPPFSQDVAKSKNRSATHDDMEFTILANLEDTKILTGLTKPTKSDLGRH